LPERENRELRETPSYVEVPTNTLVLVDPPIIMVLVPRMVFESAINMAVAVVAPPNNMSLELVVV
jgi:hypothetical protein